MGGALLGAWATALSQALPVEQRMSTAMVADFEFDWGRDGIACPDCNQGRGNNQVSFIDRRGQLWVGWIDPASGEFQPQALRGELVDTRVPFLTDYGNGATWMVSERGSELLYARYRDGLPTEPDNAAVRLAQRGAGGVWQATDIPDCEGCIVPKGTFAPTDAVPRMTYGKAGRYTVYAREAQFPSPELRIPFIDPYQGLSLRWVDGTHDVIFAAPTPADEHGMVYTQVFRYDTDRAVGRPEQLTFDPTQKRMAFMWRAPEFQDAMVFFTVADGNQMQFYRRMPGPDGRLQWTLYHRLEGPPGLPYIGGSPEAFTYNGRSWIVIALRADPNWNDFTKPTQLALVGIDPTQPDMFRMLTQDTDQPRWRTDPEYYITELGAFVYYTRIIPSTPERLPLHQGIWRIDLDLGPPQR